MGGQAVGNGLMQCARAELPLKLRPCREVTPDLPDYTDGAGDRLRLHIRRHAVTVSAGAALLTLLLSACSPGDPADRQVPDPAVIPDSRQWTVESEASGRTYQVQVSLPREYDSGDSSYQAVYLLDANAYFGTTTEIVRNLSEFDADSPGLIVVGVGYPVGQFFNTLGVRGIDLTPTRDTAYEAQAARELGDPGPLETGRAREFLGFLEGELIPLVESEYRVDASIRTLVGHSFGGLFALYSMLEAPGLFQQYVVVSPSLWWGCSDELLVCLGDTAAPDGWVLQREESLRSAGRGISGRLFLAVGDAEMPTMIDGPQRLAARLTEAAYPDLEWTLEVYTGEWHMSVVPGAISRGLRWLHFAPP